MNSAVTLDNDTVTVPVSMPERSFWLLTFGASVLGLWRRKADSFLKMVFGAAGITTKPPPTRWVPAPFRTKCSLQLLEQPAGTSLVDNAAAEQQPVQHRAHEHGRERHDSCPDQHLHK